MDTADRPTEPTLGPSGRTRTQDSRAHPLEALDPAATSLSCRRGQQIQRAGDAADSWYRVIAGVVRRCAYLPGGRRQIVAFQWPGEIFGFSHGALYHRYLEAVVDDTVVARYAGRSVEKLAARDASVGTRIRQLATAALLETEDRLLALGRRTALEKVSGFLLDMADRAPAGPAQPVLLPMSRHDIADYLAMSDETVSRALSCLRQRGAIALPTTHDLRIVDRGALSGSAAPAP